MNTAVTISATDSKVMLHFPVPFPPIHAGLPAPAIKPLAELSPGLPAAAVANHNGN
jgi:hypothetical protein